MHTIAACHSLSEYFQSCRISYLFVESTVGFSSWSTLVTGEFKRWKGLPMTQPIRRISFSKIYFNKRKWLSVLFASAKEELEWLSLIENGLSLALQRKAICSTFHGKEIFGADDWVAELSSCR